MVRSRGIRADQCYPEVSPRVIGSDADAVEDDRRAQMGEAPVCRALVGWEHSWEIEWRRSGQWWPTRGLLGAWVVTVWFRGGWRAGFHDAADRMGLELGVPF